MTSDVRYKLAVHEASHAFAYGRLHIQLISVSIKRRGNRLGTRSVVVSGSPTMRSRDSAQRRFNEKRCSIQPLRRMRALLPKPSHSEASRGAKGTTARLDLPEQEEVEWCAKAKEAAFKLLTPNMQRIDRLAYALLSAETLPGREALRILRLRAPHFAVQTSRWSEERLRDYLFHITTTTFNGGLSGWTVSTAVEEQPGALARPGLCVYKKRRIYVNIDLHEGDRAVQRTLLDQMMHAAAGPSSTNRGDPGEAFWEQFYRLLALGAPLFGN